MSSHSLEFFKTIEKTIQDLNFDKIELLAVKLKEVRDDNGKLFILGVGGSAGNAGHAVNDFRKLCLINASAPTDNVSELTARINDEGWNTSFSNWLRVSQLSKSDAILILSVGGGNLEKNVSLNIIEAIKTAREVNAKVFSIVGKENGYSAKNSDISIIIPEINEGLTTPISESFQSIVWHCLVSNPILQKMPTKW